MHTPRSPKQYRLPACLPAADYPRLPRDLERLPLLSVPARVRPLAVSILDGMH
jgi:hypothetical protein